MLLAPLLAVVAASSPVDRPHRFLLSVVAIPLKGDDSLESFAFETWGVKFKAVCHIPDGWRIKAGSSLSSNGDFEGEGSQGITWYRQSSPKELRSVVLVELFSPVQRSDIHQADGVVPATFNGYATVETDDGDRKVALNFRNIRLSPASRCPSHQRPHSTH